MIEQEYVRQIKDMADLLGKTDLKFLMQIYTLMYHYIEKGRNWPKENN